MSSIAESVLPDDDDGIFYDADDNPIRVEDLPTLMLDQWWRLCNLYWIIDDKGQAIRFRPNWAQRRLYTVMWFMNVILKARQVGFTTFIMLFALDQCVFNANYRAGIIAHNREDAESLFRDKIKFAYDHLDARLRGTVKARTDRAGELLFSNNSAIRVATSMRSGTLNLLHVSEYGKICAKYPARAKEIRTGSFEAVHAGQLIFVESTAEGREGGFHDMVVRSMQHAAAKKQLTLLDFKFHFFPWYKHPANVLEADSLVLYPHLVAYFEKLSTKHNIKLTLAQKAWYAKKLETLGDDIKREHPSYPEEAFEATLEGAYYAQQMSKARQQARITTVPFTPGVLINTYWDIGYGDSTAIWFIQTVGSEHRIVRYYENSGEGLQHYVDHLAELVANPDTLYRYGEHVWPHDGGHGEFGSGKTRVEMAFDLGMQVRVIPRSADVDAGIERVRTTLAVCWFDEAASDEGIKCLDSYRKEWDDKLGTWKKKALHNWASHGADAFRTFADAIHEKHHNPRRNLAPVVPKHRPPGGWT